MTCRTTKIKCKKNKMINIQVAPPMPQSTIEEALAPGPVTSAGMPSFIDFPVAFVQFTANDITRARDKI